MPAALDDRGPQLLRHLDLDGDRQVAHLTQRIVREFEVLDVDALGMQALSKVGIKGIPSLILYDNQGNEIKRKSGALTKKQLEVFLGLDS